MTEAFDAAAVEAALTAERLGRPLKHYPIAVTIESLALAWARKDDAPEGACVVADHELSPRQRKGSLWVSFPGAGLYASVVLRPALPPEGEDLLWLLASLAAADGVANAASLRPRLKWPDDVLVGERKVAGVRVDAYLGPGEILGAVLTFRINIDVGEDDLPPDLRAVATSVARETGSTVDRGALLDATLVSLETLYDQGVGALLDAYRSRCDTLGERVRALLLPRGEIAGLADGIDAFGSLVIRGTGGGPRTVKIDQLKKLEPLGPPARE